MELIDDAVLDTAKRILGDQFSLTLQNFLKESEEALDEIKGQPGNVERVKFVMHDIKSSSAQFGLKKLSKKTEEIEYKIINASLEKTEIPQTYFEQAIREIDDIFKQTVKVVSS